MAAGWSGRTVTRARRAIRAKGQHQACWRCGRPLDLDREKWHVGHIVDRRLGGTNAPSNTAAECPPCNLKAGGRLGGKIAAANRRAPIQRTERTRRW
ncbi:HNH endonuclease [Jiangella gansuensis]|uniref:HNH endonuclease n=1 Tax=Jiangella gansuensis TaxID=281473 RepID=UPI00047ED65B